MTDIPGINSMHTAMSLAEGYMKRRRDDIIGSLESIWLQTIPGDQIPSDDTLAIALGIIDEKMGELAASDFGEWIYQIQTMRERLPPSPIPSSHPCFQPKSNLAEKMAREQDIPVVNVPLSDPTQQRKFMAINSATGQTICKRDTRQKCEEAASYQAPTTGDTYYIVEIVATVICTPHIDIEGFHPND